MHTSSDRDGVTPVSGCDSPSRVCDIVFVHGLGGGSHSTWTADGDSERFWPAWVAADVPDAGVWTLGYRADASAWTNSSMPLADRGTALLEALVNEGIGGRPLVFIAHSMGGILVKQLLRHATSYGVARWEPVANQVRGIIFVATPHAGASLAGFAEFARLVLRTNEHVGELTAHHSRLRELHAWFLNFQRDRRFVCRTFAETRETRTTMFGLSLPGGLVVVDATSAEPHIAGEVAIPLDEDHGSICKPSRRDAPIHKSVRSFLRTVLQAARDEAQETSGSDAATGAAARLSGEWIGEVVKKGQPPYRIGIEFDVLGSRIFGTVRYPTGDGGIRDGEIDGDQIRFRTVHTPQFENSPAEIRFEGLTSGDTLQLVMQDENGHARVTARRGSEATE